MIRRLCGCLGPEPVFRELAAALAEEGDLAFAATMVQVRVGERSGVRAWVSAVGFLRHVVGDIDTGTASPRLGLSVMGGVWVGGCAGNRSCAPVPSRRVALKAQVLRPTSNVHTNTRPHAQALNLILLTSPELRELREALMAASQPPSTTQPPPTTDLPTAQPPAASGDGGDWASSPPNTAASAAAAATAPCNPNAQRGASLFVALYPCWAHAPGALLSLCLLSHAYGHTHDVVQCYRWLPIGAEVLVQVRGFWNMC